MEGKFEQKERSVVVPERGLDREVLFEDVQKVCGYQDDGSSISCLYKAWRRCARKMKTCRNGHEKLLDGSENMWRREMFSPRVPYGGARIASSTW